MKFKTTSLTVVALLLLSNITACKHNDSNNNPTTSFSEWVSLMVASDEDGEPMNIDEIVIPSDEQSDTQSFDNLLLM